MTDTDPGFGELRSGNLGVRLATGPAEVDAVQALRYRVFYEEMGARADAATAATRRDVDDFDAVADPLVVVDHDRGEGPDCIIGTYRLIRRHAAARLGRWALLLGWLVQPHRLVAPATSPAGTGPPQGPNP